MNTITQSEIELSERLRKACLEKGITEPRFVAQDERGQWYHYDEKPIMSYSAWVYGNLVVFLFKNEPPTNWRETLMEWNPIPPLMAGVFSNDGKLVAAYEVKEPTPLSAILKNTCEHCGQRI